MAQTVAVDCAETVVQAELSDCALADYERADQALNAQWRKAYRAVHNRSTEAALKLRKEQRKWIIKRDTECYTKFPSEVGVSLDKMMNRNCLTTLTQHRTKYLSDLAKGN